MELEGRYRLDRRIGAGATAEIWRGHDTLLRRPVAVRLLRADRAGDARRFLDGGRIAARLTHPGVVTVYDVGTTDLPARGPASFIVMELAAGPTLAARLDAGPLSWSETARIGAGVAAALAEAHGQWVCHGALVPAKVILTEVGAKVLGFAGVVSDDFDGPATDVRALGALLTACLDSPGPPPPADLTAFVVRCLNAEPALRPGSQEAAAALAGFADATLDLPVVRSPNAATATRPTGGRLRARWTMRTVAAASGVAALLLGAVAALGQTAPGQLPWFGHPPQVAAVPPDDDACADAALDHRVCVPAPAPTRPSPTRSVPRPSSSPPPTSRRAVMPVPPSPPASPSPTASAVPPSGPPPSPSSAASPSASAPATVSGSPSLL
ncbi:protein kinase [Dactylosporangium sp. CA-092794]|uniref:protein kinase n=1 Tax=Dactylosporangium sp. CA-092794 TaxID=3239929 RepID=UPI003D90B340